MTKALKCHGIHSFRDKKLYKCKTKELLIAYREAIKRDAVDDFLNKQEITHKIGTTGHVGYVYVIGNVQMQIIKIGFSTSPEKRLDGVQTGCPYPIILLAKFVGTRKTEKGLHKKYRRYKLNGEWFSYKGELREAIENATKSVKM